MTRASFPEFVEARPWPLLALGLLAGTAIRLSPLRDFHLNPDEALHAMLATADSWAATYQKHFLDVHPPLFNLLLHAANGLSGLSPDPFFLDAVLRLPSLLAVLLASLCSFSWARRVAPTAAWPVLAIWLASSMAVDVSVLVRQYGCLLLGLALALERLDLAVDRRSARPLPGFLFGLLFAAFSHYSAAVAVLSLGLYAVLRLPGQPRKVWLGWLAANAVAAGAYLFLWITDLSRLAGFATGPRAWYLSRQLFDPSDESPLRFGARAVFGFFHGLSGNAALGAGLLLLFGLGVFELVRQRTRESLARAALLVMPFAFGLALALAHRNPFGSTRHSSFALPFAALGIGLGVSRCVGREPSKAALAALALAVALGANLRLENTPTLVGRESLREALEALRAAPAGRPLLVDIQTWMLLGHYLDPSQPVPDPARGIASLRTERGGLRLVRPGAAEVWRFTREQVDRLVRELAPEAGLGPLEPATVVSFRWYGRERLAEGFPAERLLEARRFGTLVVLRIAPPPGGWGAATAER